MEAAAERPRSGPGRPPSGARERILEAAFEILRSDGYAGLTMAKVAAAAGENKALIGYHFGGKQGLVTAVATGVAERMVAAVEPAIASSSSLEELARSALTAVFAEIERDEGVQRVYFDLAAQSVVEPAVEATLAEVKRSFREVAGAKLRELTGLDDEEAIGAAAVFMIAGIEGLALERLDRGETPELARARELWVRSVAGALDRPTD